MAAVRGIGVSKWEKREMEEIKYGNSLKSWNYSGIHMGKVGKIAYKA